MRVLRMCDYCHLLFGIIWPKWNFTDADNKYDLDNGTKLISCLYREESFYLILDILYLNLFLCIYLCIYIYLYIIFPNCLKYDYTKELHFTAFEILRICWLRLSCKASSSSWVIWSKLDGSVCSRICSISSGLSGFFSDKSRVTSGATCFNRDLEAVCNAEWFNSIIN